MRLMKAFVATCLLPSLAFADTADTADTNGTDAAPVGVPGPVAGPVAASVVVQPAVAEPQPVLVPAAAPVDSGLPVTSSAGPKFAQEGMTEVGAGAGLTMAQGVYGANISPYVGHFVNDNLQLSGILDIANIRSGGESTTIVSALVEPSFHVPFKPTVFGFFGMGIGATYINPLGTALAIAPHVGADILIGRLGILRPSLTYSYTMHDAMTAVGPNGTTSVTVAAATSALHLNLGYSKMW